MKQTLEKIFSVVFSRFTITILLVLLQAGFFALLLLRLQSYAWWIELGFTVLAVITGLFVIWRDYTPAYKVGWIFLIGIFPALGVSLYLLFGNKKPTRMMREKLMPLEKKHYRDLEKSTDLSNMKDQRLLDLTNYIADHAHYPAWKNTSSKFYPLGDDAFEEMLDDLQKAEHFIFLEYFIIGEGKLWQAVLSVLKKKVKEGVDVRIIYDDVGSIKVIPKDFDKEMQKLGIKVINFNPVHPILDLVYNNRDHRKITVIDGYIGYTGGINIADEYANLITRFGHWKDTAVRLEGDAVWNLTVMFLNMWNSFKEDDDGYEMYKPHVYHPRKFKAKEGEVQGVVQPYADSPLDNEHVGENVYIDIINQARKYVYISTPYLIIDKEMQVALELAAKRGVHIMIVTPHIPDKPLIFALTRSYYDTLMEMGITILEYTPGFMHSKVFVSDDRLAVVGTVNMDYRSFFLHFEDAALILGASCITDIKRDFEDLFPKCQIMTEGAHYKNFFSKLFGAVLRLISPLV